MKRAIKTAVLSLLILGTVVLRASSATVFDEHKADFNYDKSQPLNSTAKVVEESAYYTKYLVYYDSVNGERIPAFLFIPKDVKKFRDSLDPKSREGYDKRTVELDGPPWPVIFFMHWLQSDKSLADNFAGKWAQYGYALLAIDGVFKGERAKPGRSILETDITDTRNNLVQQVIDCRRGVDFLETRKDIDMNRLGYFGISMGSLSGAITTAVDDRFKVVVLADGAGDFSTVFSKADLPEFKKTVEEIKAKGFTLEKAMEILKPVDPVEYVGHISPRPVLMINGKKDEIFPYEAMEALHNAANEPKAVQWYNCGHILPVPDTIMLTLKWFKFHMKNK
ncbi:MAG: prolyl oligopeptidase family serine peptidase [bacterium]